MSKRKRPRTSVLPYRKPPLLRNWCLGTILGVVIVSVVANLISDALQTPISELFHRWPKSRLYQWQAAPIMNDTNREISIEVWNSRKHVWELDTLASRATKPFWDTGPVYMIVQGDMIYEQVPRERITHTYKGDECYELSGTVFEHEPSDVEITALAPNRIVQIIGMGPNTRVLTFVQGPSINFEVMLPNGNTAKTLLPEVKGGLIVYAFQNSDNR